MSKSSIRRRRRRAAGKQAAAQRGAQRKAKRTGSSSDKWWLTLVKYDTCCARCGHLLRKGREMIYRHQPLEALCQECADKDPAVDWLPSVQWEQARSPRKKVAA